MRKLVLAGHSGRMSPAALCCLQLTERVFLNELTHFSADA